MTALAAGDVDTMVSAYAEDFSNDQGQDKAAMTEFLVGAKEQGFLDGMTSDTSAMTVMVDGATASVEGVSVEGAFGVLDLGFKLEKRDGAWIITEQNQQ